MIFWLPWCMPSRWVILPLVLCYLDLKHAVPRPTRAALAQILFHMTVMPGMDYALVEIWANMCVRLIRKKKKLAPEDLVLPWRPLYDMIERSVFTKARQKTLISEAKHLHAVIRLVEYAQRFFDPTTATDEILETILPRFTTHSVHDAMVAQGYLVLFLPVTFPPMQAITSRTTPQQYLSTIFSLWSTFTRSSTFDAQFMDLLARLAEENMHYIDSPRIGLFTKDQIKWVFTTAIRMMNLPVGSKSGGGGGGGGIGGASLTTTGYGQHGFRIDMKAGNGLFLRRKAEKYASLARFIIFTILPEQDQSGGDGDGVYTMNLLADLIQAVELYFHPSNHGTWSYILTTFVRHLAFEFLKRWRLEQENDCNIPQHRRLTPALCREFVLILRPVVFLSMFGKDQYTVGASQTTIKYLSWIEPKLIFPTLLERIYPSLETLTETHRTTSALSILTDISLPLFSRDHYPAGGKHLLPLLHLALPGIDMNDPIKTIASLMFITSALMTVPITDLMNTTSPTPGVDTMAYGEDSMNDLPRDVDDELCRLATGEFQEWLAQFIRRIFTIFENMPQHDRKKQGGAMEAGLTQMVLHACETVFGQLSNEMYDVALRLMVDFCTSQVLPSAMRAMGSLCQGITAVNPAKAAKQLIPICITNIRTELIENGASSTMTNAATSNPIASDATLHWYQHILFSVVSELGPHYLTYKDELLAIGHDMVRHCKSRRGMMWAAKFIRFSLKTLLETYPVEYRSLPSTQWNDPEVMNKSHLLWGQMGDPQHLEIQWHTPSNDEKDVALQILNEFLQPAMTRLEQLMQGEHALTSHEWTNECCRHLAVVRNCVIGSMTMILDDGEETKDLNDSDDEDEVMMDKMKQRQQHYASVEANYALSDQVRADQARAIRRQVSHLLHQLAGYFTQQKENDVESIKILIKCIRVYLSERGVEKVWLDRNKSGYNYSKNISKTPVCHKHYPRHLLVHRAYIHHLQRLKQNASNRSRGPTHDLLLTDLLELSMSSYAEIRKVSQSALSIAARSFKGSKSILMPIILDTLKPQPQSNNRMKGALYLLTHKSILMACLRDWRYIPDFILSICSAQHEDKLSIQELIRKIFLDYLSYFNQCSFGVVMLDPQGWQASINRLLPQKSAPQAPDEALVQAVLDRHTKHKAVHEQLTRSLLTLLANPRMHWRFATMASNFLELLLRAELPPTADLCSYFASTCLVSELPAMRRIGISATTQLLLYIKQRTFAQGNLDRLITKTTCHPLKQTRSTDALRQAAGNLPDESLAETFFLIDDTTTGWYVWPKEVVGYLPYSDAITLPSIDVDSQGGYDTLQQIFSSADYWTQLMNYMAQEPSQKQDDRFNSSHARFFASLFQMYPAHRSEDLLACARTQLTQLCASSENKNNQRAAAELTAGLIRGTKHWPLHQVDQLWTGWLNDVLKTTLAVVTPDAHSYWASCIRFCMAKRDPRRLKHLMHLLLHEDPFDPESDAAFTEARKLLFIRAMVVGLKWRFRPWSTQLLDTYVASAAHPYKQVRDVLGANLNDLLQIQWVPSYPTVRTLVELETHDDQVPYPLDPPLPHMTQLLTMIDTSLASFHQADPAERTASHAYTTTSKTVLCWLREALTHWQMAGTLPAIVPFFPRVMAMQELSNNLDQDLQAMASQVLTLMIAHMTYPPHMLATASGLLTHVLTTSDSWHLRIRSLPLLQIFFFKHLVASSSDNMAMMDMVGGLLLDPQIEVRAMAGITLSGMVRCSSRQVLEKLRTKYTTMLRQPLPKRSRQQQRDERGKTIDPPGWREAVLHKHAGALGLACLVNAFPYEVPAWMPPVLCQLAECMSDPAEIQSTIRKTFSDFRRTHSDTWHEDVTKFTEDQLSMLSDMLISPSYYA
ncbi:hypothetical protein BCR42DRAFT_474389 [Absidia repens]|uniref:Uncharacterized protein n=1 Tax=Absidia repens TaxID=90262 RepID=A0A1X2HXH7_9FUNG|nr:hypothetical protein BCR42DRAFT_474389 [Absidia repens]